MTTITVPLNNELNKFIHDEVKSGKGESKAHVVRYALMRLREERALERLAEAEADIASGRVYKGSLDILAKKLPE
jgi:Arc/MetJ-type ribon-helix-helix transcriptional regulator